MENQQNKELVRLMVEIENLIDALEGRMDILREGQHESAAMENESKRQLQGSKHVSEFLFSGANFSVSRAWMNRFLIYLWVGCHLLSRVV